MKNKVNDNNDEIRRNMGKGRIIELLCRDGIPEYDISEIITTYTYMKDSKIYWMN